MTDLPLKVGGWGFWGDLSNGGDNFEMGGGGVDTPLQTMQL